MDAHEVVADHVERCHGIPVKTAVKNQGRSLPLNQFFAHYPEAVGRSCGKFRENARRTVSR